MAKSKKIATETGLKSDIRFYFSSYGHWGNFAAGKNGWLRYLILLGIVLVGFLIMLVAK